MSVKAGMTEEGMTAARWPESQQRVVVVVVVVVVGRVA
jgi:hypothetical protein